jgi:transposase
MLPVTRAGAVEVRRRALQQLPALIVSAPEEIRRTLRGRSGRSLITRCRTLRAPRGADLALIATVAGPRGLARRVVVGQRRGQGARARHRRARAGPLPPAMAELGVGPISAAQLLVSSSHAGRFPGEAAFAAQLAGVAPVPAPSGRVMRHRLNRGGIGASTRRFAPSSSSVASAMSGPGPTSSDGSPRASAPARPSAASSAPWPATSTGCWRLPGSPLDGHRSVTCVGTPLTTAGATTCADVPGRGGREAPGSRRIS